MAVREAGRGRVLVVEDDESTALFVTRVLARSGFEAAWVSDAEQASQRLAGERFDVLLADCRLPGRSGIELARETRRLRPAVAVALMTSFTDIDLELAARTSGAEDFFEKPLHSSNLVSRVQSLVTRSRASRRGAPDAPSARGALEASPMESAPGASSRNDAPGSPDVAEGGSDEPAVPRDTAVAQLDAAVADGAAQPRPEGAEGVRRTRSPAPFDLEGGDGSGCEERRDAFLREEAGRLDRDLLARVAHPAFSHLLAQHIAAQQAMGRVVIWASGAPAVSIGSGAGHVTAPFTRPSWSLAR